jgi:hypothetical protein
MYMRQDEYEKSTTDNFSGYSMNTLYKKRVLPTPLEVPSTATSSEHAPANPHAAIDASLILKKKRDKLRQLINSNVTFFCDFHNKEMKKSFYTFIGSSEQQHSKAFFIMMLSVATFMYFPQAVIRTVMDFELNNGVGFHSRHAVSIIGVVVSFGCVVTGWLLIFQQRVFNRLFSNQDKLTDSTHHDLESTGNYNSSINHSVNSCICSPLSYSTWTRFTRWLGLMNIVTVSPIQRQRLSIALCWTFLFLSQAFCSVNFIRDVFDMNCSYEISSPMGNSLRHTLLHVSNADFCFAGNERQKIGWLNVQSIILFLWPVLLFQGTPQVPILCVWLNIIFALSMYLATTVWSGNYGAIPTAIISMLFAFFLARDIQIRNISVFLSSVQVEETIVSSSKALEENYANEMRSLIANVAHDLKTVSFGLLLVDDFPAVMLTNSHYEYNIFIGCLSISRWHRLPPASI